jgi:hypothetical protein
MRLLLAYEHKEGRGDAAHNGGHRETAMALSEVGEHYSVAQQQVQELRQRLRERRVQLCDIQCFFSLSLAFFSSCSSWSILLAVASLIREGDV